MPMFGQKLQHDVNSCEYCLRVNGRIPILELPLKNQKIALHNITRVGLLLNEAVFPNSEILQLQKFQEHLEDCFKIDLFRVYTNEHTSLTTNQNLFEQEIDCLSRHMKAHHHLFIYLNVWRNMDDLKSMNRNCNIWIILDFDESWHNWEKYGPKLQNVVVIGILNKKTMANKGQISLKNCFAQIRRETLSSMVTRLSSETNTIIKLFSKKPQSSTYFGFG